MRPAESEKQKNMLVWPYRPISIVSDAITFGQYFVAVRWHYPRDLLGMLYTPLILTSDNYFRGV